jgi:hypothetical protein
MDAAIETEILRQLHELRAGSSISPTDVARVLRAEKWQGLLGPIRATSLRMASEGKIEILRKGKPVAPNGEGLGEIKGVIRIRLPATAPSPLQPSAQTLGHQ